MPIVDKSDGAFKALLEGELAFECTVGIHEAEGGSAHSLGLTNAEVGAFHEFGLGVPQRSWLRGWLTENQTTIEGWQADYVAAVLDGQNPKQQQDLFALKVEASIKERILSGIGRPLSDAVTSKRGANAVPLLDTSQFLGAIKAISQRLLT